MKKIEAIIAPTEFEAVREGLRAAGILARLVITPACGLQCSSAFSSPGAALIESRPDSHLENWGDSFGQHGA